LYEHLQLIELQQLKY